MAHTTNSTFDLVDEITHNRNFTNQHGASRIDINRQDNAHQQFDQFMAHMGNHVAPGANVLDLQWWSTEYPNDEMGALMANYMLFMIYFRDDGQWGTVGLETLRENMMRPFHEEVRLRFPNLVAGHYTYAHICHQSERFNSVQRWIVGACGGRGFGSGKVNTMVGPDLERFTESVAWEPHGYRLISLISANLEIGARHMSLSLTMPQNGFRRPDGSWQLKWVQVKTDPRRNDNNKILDGDASTWISRFYNTKGMTDFHSTNNFLCLATVEATDGCLETLGIQAGYPSGGYFSTSSLRAGAATTKVVNLILNGEERGRAVEIANRNGGWSIGKENIRYYLDWFMVGLAEHYANDPAYTSINDFTVLQLHPDLSDINGFLVPDPLTGTLEMPGPFRTTRFCSNSGLTEELEEAMDNLFNLIRQPNDPLIIPAHWSYARKCDTIQSRLWQNVAANNYPLPASWNVAANSLTHSWDGAPNPRPLCKARSVLVNLLLRNRFLNAHDFQNQTLEPIPQGMLDNLDLFQKPPDHDPPRKAKREVNGMCSSDLPSYRLHVRRRRHNRSMAVVSVAGETTRVEEMSHAQAVLFQNNRNPTAFDWNFAGTQP